jgi:hypothetical protein
MTESVRECSSKTDVRQIISFSIDFERELDLTSVSIFKGQSNEHASPGANQAAFADSKPSVDHRRR